jgi:hypothetical protein
MALFTRQREYVKAGFDYRFARTGCRRFDLLDRTVLTVTPRQQPLWILSRPMGVHPDGLAFMLCSATGRTQRMQVRESNL